MKIKKCVDAIVTIGEPVTDNKHIDAILDGLPNEYDNFVMNVTMRNESYTIAEVEALLMNQEEMIEKHKRTIENSNNNQVITANVAQSSSSTNQNLKNINKNVAQNTGNLGRGNFSDNSSNNRGN